MVNWRKHSHNGAKGEAWAEDTDCFPSPIDEVAARHLEVEAVGSGEVRLFYGGHNGQILSALIFL